MPHDGAASMEFTDTSPRAAARYLERLGVRHDLTGSLAAGR